MSGWDKSAITLAVFLPTFGALVIAFVPRSMDRLVRALGILFSGAALLVGILMLFGFDYGAHDGLQFELKASWISAINANYHVGVDGISLPLFELTLLLTFLCAIYTWRFLPQPGRPKAFLALMLLLETGMAGTFISFDLVQLARQGGAGLAVSRAVQNLIFAGLFLGFAIKVPMWPFHTWLPDAHTEAPTVGSVLLAGILLKMGSYGFIRIALPILPQAAKTWAPAIAILAVIAIVYASLACLAQRDLKRLIAFSSVGHMGFVMLGIATLTTIGINAALFGMVAHGIITGMLFFEVGSIYDRYHTRLISDIGGGMLQKVPLLAGIFAFTAIASLGLPGLAGFWGEVLALLSSYSPAHILSGHVTLFRTLMVFGGIGTILTAGYFLWTLQRVNLGTLPDAWRERALPDVTAVEMMAWTPLLVGILFLGLFPRVVFGTTNDAVASLARLFTG